MIIATFLNCRNNATATGLWQWDYGQVLRIQGLSLPEAVEIHFSLQEKGGEAVTRIGTTKDGVTDVVIPDSMLEVDTAQNYFIYAFVYLTDDSSGQTEYKITMPITARPKPEGRTGDDTTTMAAIISAVNDIANGRADGLTYKDHILTLLSGEKKLADVNIDDFPTGLFSSLVTTEKSSTLAIADITNMDFDDFKQYKYINDTTYTVIQILYNDAKMTILGDFGFASIQKNDNMLTMKTDGGEYTFELVDGTWTTSSWSYLNNTNFLTKLGMGLLSAIITDEVSESTAIADISGLVLPECKWKRYINDTQYNMIRFDYNGEMCPVLGVFGILNVRKTSNTIQIRSNNLSVDFKLIDGAWRAVSYVYATTDDVLTKTNTADYVPADDYHPATKKYVDDNVKTPRQEIDGTSIMLNMAPNTLYVCAELQELTPMFGRPADTSVVSEYRVIFISGATATAIDWTYEERFGSGPIILPSGFTVKPNKIYELSIMENLLTYQEWDYGGE